MNTFISRDSFTANLWNPQYEKRLILDGCGIELSPVEKIVWTIIREVKNSSVIGKSISYVHDKASQLMLPSDYRIIVRTLLYELRESCDENPKAMEGILGHDAYKALLILFI